MRACVVEIAQQSGSGNDSIEETVSCSFMFITADCMLKLAFLLNWTHLSEAQMVSQLLNELIDRLTAHRFFQL